MPLFSDAYISPPFKTMQAFLLSTFATGSLCLEYDLRIRKFLAYIFALNVKIFKKSYGLVV